MEVGGSNPLFLTHVIFKPPWWNGRHSRLKIYILLVQVRQEVRAGFKAFRPDDGMVDVTDLGSVFWQFKSASGHYFPILYTMLRLISARLVKW